MEINKTGMISIIKNDRVFHKHKHTQHFDPMVQFAQWYNLVEI